VYVHVHVALSNERARSDVVKLSHKSRAQCKSSATFSLRSLMPYEWVARCMSLARLRVALAIGFGALAVSALLAVTRVAPADSDAGGESKVVAKTLTRADAGGRIELRVGEVVVVRLPENASTGFVWSRENASDALRLVGSEYLPAGDGRVGSGGQRSLSFQAVATGTAQLRLKLWREWEGDKSIVDRFAVTVQVVRRTPQAKQ
jgi:inhibitor of cysteine peptidase